MSKTWLEPFKAEHMVNLAPREQEYALYMTIGKEAIANILEAGPGWTVMCDAGPVGSGGVLKCWRGVGEAWAYAGKRVYDYRISYFKAVCSCLREISNAFDLHRVQAHVDTNFPESFRFCRALGFELESIMPKFGPHQEDYYRLVWFPEEN